MNDNTAHTTASPQSSQFFGFLVLALFFISHNISTVFYQIRGVDESHYQGSVAGYFLGIFVSALLLRPLQRAFGGRGAARAAGRLALLGITLFPGFFCLATPFLLPQEYAGTFFINSFQPALWAMQLPLAIHLFFLHARPSQQAYYYCLALCAGHLCWSLLIPLAHMGALVGAADFIENRYLPFLNIARVLTSIAFARLAFMLMPAVSATAGSGRAAQSALPQAAQSPDGKVGGSFVERFFRSGPVLILIPLLVCFFYNGVQGYLYFPRLVTRGLYAEYLHLLLAALFPLLGLLLRNGGFRAPGQEGPDLETRQQTLLRRLMISAALCFALAPVILTRVPYPPAFQAMYFLCAVCVQILFMTGTLALGRHAAASRYPSLTASSAWLAGAAAIAGNIAANRLFPLLPVSSAAIIILLCLACCLSLLCLRRAFPLMIPPPQQDVPLMGPAPQQDVPQEKEAPEPDPASIPAPAPAPVPAPDGNAPGRNPSLEERKAEYAARHKLSKREKEVMGLLIQGRSTDEIAGVLGLKITSVRHYIYTLLKKTGAGSRLALVSEVMGSSEEILQ